MQYGHLVRMDESADARRILSAVPWSDWKGRQDVLTLPGWPQWLSEEQPIISQPQCKRCHQAGTGQATLEVISSKQSCALKWCKLNDDDDDDVLLCSADGVIVAICLKCYVLYCKQLLYFRIKIVKK